MVIPGPLPPPPEDISGRGLPVVDVNCSWFRSHALDRSPIYYGKEAHYRFNDPAGEYGVLYVAQDPYGAFVETFGQFASAVQNPRQITSGELSTRALSELVCSRPLKLVDLTGRGLALLGADARLFAGDHQESRCWSRALYNHPDQVDGLYYPARHDPTRKAAAIFNESLSWTTISRQSWMSLGLVLRDVLNEYGFALIESQVVQPAVRKSVKQEGLF